MLRLASYDIVFQEVPGEVTLALNLSLCPNRCPGCHSPHLRGAVGERLDDALLAGLLSRYGDAVTCVAFMGGDNDPAEVNRLAAAVHAWGNAPDVRGCEDTAIMPGCESAAAVHALEGDAATVHGLGSEGIEVVHGLGGDDAPVVQGLESDDTPAVHAVQGANLKTAWYTGREELPETIALENLDFIKLGPYDPTRGGLDSPTTNQRFYRVEHATATQKLIDETASFQKTDKLAPA